MKKLGIFLVLAVSAFAFGGQKAPAKKETTPKKIHCAVMPTDELEVAAATKAKMYTDYKGRRYFFCCAGCPKTFAKNPEKFAKTAESLPIPAAPKKAKKK